MECSRLSNSDILKFSPKKKLDSRNSSVERIPIIPSIKAKSHLNGISGNEKSLEKKVSAEKDVITIDEDAEDDVVPEGSDVSMSGSDPQQESDERDNVTESVTTLVEDDEVTLNLKADPVAQESIHDNDGDDSKLQKSFTPCEMSATSPESEKIDDDNVIRDETSTEVASSTTCASTEPKPQSRRKLLRSQITKVVPKIEVNGDSNDKSDSKVDDVKENVDAVEEVKTIANTQIDEVKTSADSDSKLSNDDLEIPSPPQEPVPLPDPPALKNRRGEKRKRFQSDLSSSGSGVSSSSRDPSPVRKVR